MEVSLWRSASALASSARISSSTSAYFFLPMVRWHTMATRAAPMAPMMAAALPPPGVAFWLASSSRNLSMALCLIMRSGHLLGQSVDLLGVEHRFRAFKQLADAGTMQPQFEATDAERTEAELAVPLLALVGRLDAFQAKRRLRVHVGDRLDGRVALPVRDLDQLHADGAGGEHDLRAFEVLGARCLVGALHGRNLHAEAGFDRLRRLPGTFLRPRGDHDVGTFLR